MKLSRRHFAINALLIPLGSLFGVAASGGEKQQSALSTGSDTEFKKAFADMQQKVIAFHREAGYQQISEQSLITGQVFNGGLRYDDSGVLANTSNGEMVLQGCARIEDLPLKERQGVLPFFHIFACTRRPDMDRRKTLEEAMDFVTTMAGLPTQRLALVSLSSLGNYRDLLADQGIDWERQVLIRNTEEAKSAGDGSGYFKPENHPEHPEEITAGLYIWTGEGQAPAVKTYPLPEQWVEIGEVALNTASALAYGFGLERLVYARTGALPSWQDQRQHLLRRVETESTATGTSLPEGYYLFKNSVHR